MAQFWEQGEPIRVRIEDDEVQVFYWRGTWHAITQIQGTWRIHQSWWDETEQVWLDYLKVTTQDGYLCILYHDLVTKDWFLARIFD